MIPLAFLQKGEKAEIVNTLFFKKQTGRRLLIRLANMGLTPGKIVEVLNNTGRGPVLVKIDETRIAIGRGMAMKIMVRRVL